MKYSVQPTSVEKVMKDDEIIVSKTDLKGRITYGNQIFIEFSGYTEQELLGAPHNIIRHPDMPRGVFKLLWDAVQSGKEIFAYVKNMSKDGSYYWVLANVTPVRDVRGTVVGYTSVRRKPSREAIAKVEPLYRAMLQAERSAAGKDAVQAGVDVALEALKQAGMEYDQFVLSL